MLQCAKCGGAHYTLDCPDFGRFPDWDRFRLGVSPLANPYFLTYDVKSSDLFPSQNPDPKSFRLEEQVAGIVNAAGTDGWRGHAEAPPPPPEIADTYAVAWAQAVRSCTHKRSSRSTTLASRERQCDDCGRYFTGSRGLFE